MRWICITLNAALILVLFWFFLNKGLPHDAEQLLLVYLSFASPVASLFVVFRSREPKKESLLSLYLKRKRLEEERRIESLRK